MDSEVRVRFAPSPTGKPHVGNLRTALFNWLFARRYGGKFILRVEDTDRERYVEGALDSIMGSLKWLGLDWDEGPEVGGPYSPYFQSQRQETYRTVSQGLIDGGFAYQCYCSRERLDEMRREQQRRKLAPRYDRNCRDLSPRETQQYAAQAIVPVVRFKSPLSGDTNFHDLIRGEVTWLNELLDDVILVKSDGYPTYHLANVVDDHLMRISHVLRAEEWLPSTPRHLQLYRALGYTIPHFAHLPIILGPDRAKLSKRHGTVPILEYRDMGFLPDAMVNFMALLGWSLDDKTDVISRGTLVEHFSIERIGKSGAIFDKEKLLWMNGVYIRQLSQKKLAEKIVPFIALELGRDMSPAERGYARRIVPLVQERLKTLGEVAEKTSYFFHDQIAYDPVLLIQKGMDEKSSLSALMRSREVLSSLENFDSASLEEVLRSTGTELGITGRQLFGALRVAITGRTAAPPLFQTMEVLGKSRCVERIAAAVHLLEGRSKDVNRQTSAS